MNLLQGIRRSFLLFSTVLFSFSMPWGVISKTYASSSSFYNLELSAAGGFNWLRTHNTDLIVSPAETDSTQIDNISNNAAWKVGIGYYLFGEQLASRSFFNTLLLEFNIYRSTATIHGNLWQFGYPQFNSYRFEAPISSTRFMLDMKPGLFTWSNLTAYPIIGIGATQNKMSYSEVSADPGCVLVLNSRSSAHLAWDLGMGTRFLFNKHLTLTVEYTYAFLGHGRAGNSMTINHYSATSPNFSIQTQNLLFGLNLTF